MAFSTTVSADEMGRVRDLSNHHAEAAASAVSWGAVLAGAAAAASLSLILLILGVGLGLSSVSPWSRSGIGAAALGVSTIAWLTLTQVLASVLGGYLAGRLRTKWTAVHGDEVYFRDTAHGFLAWAAATLATAALLSSVIGGIVSGGAQAGAALAGGGAAAATSMAGGMAGGMAGRTAAGADSGPMGYFVDTLFRREARATPAADPAAPGTMNNTDAPRNNNAAEAAEVARIFVNASRTEALPPEDLRQVGQIVAQRTGLSQADAERRVTDLHARAQAKWHDAEVAAREAADKARKASAASALWLFISLLIGAFSASLAATFGGRRRDA